MIDEDRDSEGLAEVVLEIEIQEVGHQLSE
jgi:hypothetical protein